MVSSVLEYHTEGRISGRFHTSSVSCPHVVTSLSTYHPGVVSIVTSVLTYHTEGHISNP